MDDSQFDEIFGSPEAGEADVSAPSKLKSRVYTALIRRQQESGPLESLPGTKAAGGKLCVFEALVQIAPAGERAESLFYCSVCHARILAEHLENPPIWWPNCPYAGFKKS